MESFCIFRVVLIVVTLNVDSKFKGFLPSVMAASIMCIVSKEIEPENALDYRNQLMSFLNITEVCSLHENVFVD